MKVLYIKPSRRSKHVQNVLSVPLREPFNYPEVHLLSLSFAAFFSSLAGIFSTPYQAPAALQPAVRDKTPSDPGKRLTSKPKSNLKLRNLIDIVKILRTF